MKGTRAGEVVAGQARDANVAELAMGEAARRLAVDDQPHADPGPDRDVGEILHALPGTPAHLGKRGAVDVGVQCGRNTGCGLQAAEYVRPAPARLRRARDPAII